MRSCNRSSSTRISPTPASTSVCDTSCRHPLGLDDPGDGHDLVAAHDERPAFTVGAGNLGIDEHILDLPGAACEPIARPPPSYLKPWEPRLDQPRPPRDRAVQVLRAGLEPEPLVLAHGVHAVAEVEALRTGARIDQLGERRRHRAALVERAQ